MDLTSPLTTLGSISTPESYYTARDSSNAADETTITSPGAEDDEVPQTFGYREAIQLPHELKSHCQIHLEEQLCQFPSSRPSPLRFSPTASI
jgi:hypothetical protein